MFNDLFAKLFSDKFLVSEIFKGRKKKRITHFKPTYPPKERKELHFTSFSLAFSFFPIFYY